jgi:hypothetical protein
MNTMIQTINPKFIEHEGMWYLEYNGGFYKGCRRCGGEGHYSHNGEHSRCYECDNTSAKLGEYISDDRKDAEKWCHVRALAKANRERKAEEARLKLVAARDERVAALTASNPEVVALLQKTYDDENEAYATGDYAVIQRTNPFLRTMAGKLFNAGEKGLTENMIAAVGRMVEKEAVKAAEAESHPAPEGRVVVTGEIVGTKVVESDFGTVYKITVKDDQGFRVYVSLPKAQADEAFEKFDEEAIAAGFDRYTFGPSVWFLGTADGQSSQWKGLKGRRITFTATLEASRDDKSFAFGSRPTKGAWLA